MVLSVFIFILYAVTSIIYILYSEWGGGTEKKIGFHFGLKKYFGFELGSKDFRVCLSALCMHPLLNAKQMFGDSHHTTKLFWVSIFQKNMGLTKTLHTPHTHIQYQLVAALFLCGSNYIDVLPINNRSANEANIVSLGNLFV